MIGYLVKDMRPLVLLMPKMSGYVKTFKVGEKMNKLMPFCTDDEKLLKTYKAIWTNTENLKIIELNDLPVYDDRCIKTKIRTYSNKVYINICSLNVPEGDIKCKSFTVASIDLFFLYENKY